MNLTPERIIAAASAYVGTRWHHQGRSTAGVDCIGLLVLTARDLGLPVADETGYSRQPSGHQLQAALAAHLTPIAEPEPGAVLLMRFDRDPQHVALMADGGDIIHAYATARRVVRHRLDDTWARRIVAVYRFHGVAA
jgi:cell wall-associated NlpC family hydrolase